MEEALLKDIQSGGPFIPHVVTDFSSVEGLEKPLGTITCFEAPHRIFDAILRDSLLDGTHFPHTDTGKRIAAATSRDATAIFQSSPASLLFGSWDSTGITGGLGEKYTRCVVSEVVGVKVERMQFRAGTRVDPLNIAAAVAPGGILRETGDKMWEQIGGNRANIQRPSELNHGSVPWDGGSSQEPHGGVTCDSIRFSTTISFPALRLLGFPADNAEASSRAHTVLAAMALHAAALSVERGWHLRSRCDLILDEGEKPEWEVLGEAKPQHHALTADKTRKLLEKAIEQAGKVDLPWRKEPIRLTPSPALQQLVIASQEAHRTAPAGD